MCKGPHFCLSNARPGVALVWVLRSSTTGPFTTTYSIPTL